MGLDERLLPGAGGAGWDASARAWNLRERWDAAMGGNDAGLAHLGDAGASTPLRGLERVFRSPASPRKSAMGLGRPRASRLPWARTRSRSWRST